MIDRMEFPRKYKLKDSLLIIAILAMLFGVWLNNFGQKKILQNVSISQVRIEDYSSQHVEISYRVENKLRRNLELRILAAVFDTEGKELSSSMYMLEIEAGQTKYYSKIFDNLSRNLAEGEVPAQARVRIYPRRII